MALLQYDLAVVGQDRMKAIMRSVERDIAAHARRLERNAGLGAGSIRRGNTGLAAPSASRSREMRETFRGFDQIGKAGAAAERKRHQEVMRNLKAEERAKLAAIRAEERAQQHAARNARATRQRFAQGAVSGVGGAVRNTAMMGAGMLGLGGGVALYGAAQKQMAAQGLAAELAGIHFGASATDKRSRAQIQSDVMGRASTLSRKSGIGREEIISGLTRYQEKSGDLKGGERLMGFMAELRDAKGGELGDYGEFAGLVRQSMVDSGESDEGKLDAGVKRALSGAAAMAAAGQISMADMAGMGGTVAAVSGRQGGDPIRNMLDAMATMNIAIRGGATSPQEAATAAARFTDDLIENQGKFKKRGVKVFDDRGDLRGMDQIVLDSLGATGGNLTQLTDLFGVRGMRAIETQAKLFRSASGGKTDKASVAKGLAAVKAEQERFFSADVSDADRVGGAEFRRDQGDRKISRLKEEFDQKVGAELMPAITAVIPELTKAIPVVVKGVKSFAEFVQWFSDNPLKGIGAIIAAQVALDVAKAGIGKALVAMISSASVPGTGLGAGGAAAGGGALATLGWAGAAVGATGLALNQLQSANQISGHNKGWRKVGSLNPFANDAGEMGIGETLSGINPFDTKNFYGGRLLRSAANLGQGLWDTMGTDAADQARQKQAWAKREAADSLNGIHDFGDWKTMTDQGGMGAGSPWAAGFGMAPGGAAEKELSERADREAAQAEARKSPAEKAMEALAVTVASADSGLSSFAASLKAFDPNKALDRGGGPTKP